MAAVTVWIFDLRPYLSPEWRYLHQFGTLIDCSHTRVIDGKNSNFVKKFKTVAVAILDFRFLAISWSEMDIVASNLLRLIDFGHPLVQWAKFAILLKFKMVASAILNFWFFVNISQRNEDICIRLILWRPCSLTLADFVANRKTICKFLLVINSRLTYCLSKTWRRLVYLLNFEIVYF